MLFYFALNILFALFSIIELLSRKCGITKLLFGTSVFILFILSFIRWETGTDWEHYLKMYFWIRVPWEDFYSGMEYGFLFVENLGKSIFDDYTGVLFIFALIIYGCICYAYPRLCRYPMVALWVSFCVTFASMLFVRQNVAGAILLISLMCAYRHDFKGFIFSVFIASLFHRTAWAFIIVYPLFNRVYTQKTITIGLLVSVVVGLAMSKFILGTLGVLFSGVIEAKINTYLELGTNDNSMSYSTSFILLKGFANRCVLLILFLFEFKESVRKNDRLLNGLLNVYVFGTILYCSLLPLSISLARVAVYMDIVQIFLISTILVHQKRMANRLLLFFVLWCYYIIRFYTYLMSYEHEFMPFNTIFS